jgi:hypothetical protein
MPPDFFKRELNRVFCCQLLLQKRHPQIPKPNLYIFCGPFQQAYGAAVFLHKILPGFCAAKQRAGLADAKKRGSLACSNRTSPYDFRPGVLFGAAFIGK